eukprot:CAMPEP_0118645576 /NCGR_PEP_ID=MMETSP0785-20121206/7580_1 /TAXON_ID=91992 /ORGANISM="Bolidomonas pacifica, Strain CCMP 1866" /LENGTH=92 /DNA_ID=CAMNT_0006537479 /DNA_START=96 /DNA_END=371 /DNA_ORIENTATION=+
MEYKEDDHGSEQRPRYDESAAEDSKSSDDDRIQEEEDDSEKYDVRGDWDEGVAAKIQDSSPPRKGDEEVDETVYKRTKGLSFDTEGEEKEEE